MDYPYNTAEMTRIIGLRFKKYRIWAGLTQKEAALKAGVSLSTIRGFETGTAANVSIETFLKLMNAVGNPYEIDDILPEMPDSPYLDNSSGNQRQRVKH